MSLVFKRSERVDFKLKLTSHYFLQMSEAKEVEKDKLADKLRMAQMETPGGSKTPKTSSSKKRATEARRSPVKSPEDRSMFDLSSSEEEDDHPKKSARIPRREFILAEKPIKKQHWLR